MRSIVFAALTLVASVATAAPDPFGLEMTKDCEAQLNGMSAEVQGVNKYSHGPMYDVPTSGIDFRGLKSVNAICNADGKLVAILADLNKEVGGGTFDRLVNMLRGKYETVSVKSAHVGNQSAEFQSGNVVIKVEEPHMSRTTSLIYMTDGFETAFNNTQQQEQRQQQSQERNAL